MSSINSIQEVVHSTVKREKFTVSWLEGNIFKINIHESAFIELDDIREIQIHKAQMTKGAKYCVLFICPHFGDLTRESRAYLALPETNINAVAKAIITPNLGTRMLADFFILVNKPPVIHKAFSELGAAYQWLNEKMDQAHSV